MRMPPHQRLRRCSNWGDTASSRRRLFISSAWLGLMPCCSVCGMPAGQEEGDQGGGVKAAACGREGAPPGWAGPRTGRRVRGVVGKPPCVVQAALTPTGRSQCTVPLTLGPLWSHLLPLPLLTLEGGWHRNPVVLRLHPGPASAAATGRGRRAGAHHHLAVRVLDSFLQKAGRSSMDEAAERHTSHTEQVEALLHAQHHSQRSQHQRACTGCTQHSPPRLRPTQAIPPLPTLVLTRPHCRDTAMVLSRSAPVTHFSRSGPYMGQYVMMRSYRPISPSIADSISSTRGATRCLPGGGAGWGSCGQCSRGCLPMQGQHAPCLARFCLRIHFTVPHTQSSAHQRRATHPTPGPAPYAPRLSPSTLKSCQPASAGAAASSARQRWLSST